jgi:DeoR family glycerol-3-phosphate regulon repressor/DeoR family fructose operon transcriptional repressor
MTDELPAARRSRLLQYVEQRGNATVVALSEELQVSRDTIRRDIETLAGMGLVSKTHGGVIAASNLAGRTVPVAWRAGENLDAKRKIGAAAAQVVGDGETLFVGGGTTILEIVRALRGKRGLTIVTNSLLVPGEVPADVADEILVIGGRVREGALSTYGALELPGVTRLVADRAFVGVSGISIEGEFSVAAAADAVIVREMITHARVPVVAADTSKFGKDAFARVASFGEVSMLITDGAPPSGLAAALAQSEVELVIAS